MRISFGLTALIGSAVAAAASREHIQVYLHPQPTAPSVHFSTPTLSASQAKAVLAHHLGESVDDFEELPQDEGTWAHLVSLWKGQAQRPKARVVIIEGGVSPQGIARRLRSDPS